MMCGEKWLETGSPFFSDKEQIEILKADLDRLHRERDNFHIQCSAQAEEIERLNEEVKSLKTALSEVHDD